MSLSPDSSSEGADRPEVAVEHVTFGAKSRYPRRFLRVAAPLASVAGFVVLVAAFGVAVSPTVVALNKTVEAVERAVVRDLHDWVNRGPVQSGATRAVPEFRPFVAEQVSPNFARRVTGAQLDGRGIFVSTAYESRFIGTSEVDAAMRLCSLAGEFMSLNAQPIVGVFVLSADGTLMASRQDISRPCSR